MTHAPSILVKPTAVRRLRLALALAIAAVVALAGWTIRGHEQTLQSGRIVYLQLVPVDPRSIMQGDYMTLSYAEERPLNGYLRDAHTSGALSSAPLYAYLQLDDQGRATFIGTGDAPATAANTVSMRIQYSGRRALLGPNAFFFQEGHAAIYEPAAWGMFRVAGNGKTLLVGLLDAQLKPLGTRQY